MTTMVEALARKAATSPLKASELPHTGAYPWLSLLCCLVSGLLGLRLHGSELLLVQLGGWMGRQAV